MEKLQKALQKAREQRPQQEIRSGSGEAAPAPAHPAGVDDRWAALAPFEPDGGLLKRHLVVTFGHEPDGMAFDILRTKIVLTMHKNGWKRIAITSPSPVCGKSTVAANLALGSTRQRDARTILVELDLRRPSLGRILGLRPPHDVTEMLSGTRGFGEQAVCLEGNVALSVAQRSARDPVALLLNRTTKEALARVEADYEPDLMIFDSPPLLVSDDTRAFLREVDCALIVARAESSTVAQIDICEREVAEQTNVLGVVLNQCRFTDPHVSYEAYT